MPKQWNIGKEARFLDEKSIKERMKIESRSLKKMIFAMLIYVCVMTLFMIIL